MYSFKERPEAVSWFHWGQGEVEVMGRHYREGNDGVMCVENAGGNLQKDPLVVRITNIRARRDQS